MIDSTNDQFQWLMQTIEKTEVVKKPTTKFEPVIEATKVVENQPVIRPATCHTEIETNDYLLKLNASLGDEIDEDVDCAFLTKELNAIIIKQVMES